MPSGFNNGFSSGFGNLITYNVTQTLTFNQTVFGTNSTLYVTQITTETLATYNPNLLITQITIEPLIAYNPNLLLTQISIEVLRTVTDSVLINETTNQTLSFSESYSETDQHNETINQTLTFSQILVGLRLRITNEITNQTLIFNETITYAHGHILTANINQTLTFNQFINYDHGLVINKTINQIITFIQSITSIYKHHVVHDTLLFNQTILNIKSNLLNNNLIFNQLIHYNHSFKQALKQPIEQLIFHEHISYIKTHLNQTINQQLIFINPDNINQANNRIIAIPLNNQTIIIPPLIFYVKSAKDKCSIIIQNNQTGNLIRLPCPLFGDTQSNLSSNIIKRTMMGGLYSYTKNSILNKLNYAFSVDTYKALLFRKFLIDNNNHSEQLQLTNWKGEIWLGFIMNNPVEFTTKGRWSTGLRPDNSNALHGGNKENIIFSLDFQGIKIN